MRFSETSPSRRTATMLAACLSVLALSAWRMPFHLHLLRSTPEANASLNAQPDSIRLWFSQTPELKVTTVKLTGPNNAAIPLAPLASRDSALIVAQVKGKMPVGTYTVAWRTMAKDGHIARGTFGFSVAPARR